MSTTIGTRHAATDVPLPGEVRSSISSAARHRSTVRGVAIFVSHILSYSAYFIGAIYFDSWIINGLLSMCMGFSIAGMFMVGHDAAHDSFTPRPRLNRWIARISFLPPWMPYTAWKYTHNYLHHGYTSLRTHDPIWRPLSPEEYQALSGPRRLMQRVYRSIPGLSLQWIFASWIPHRLFPNAEIVDGMRRWKGRVADQWLVFVFAMTQVTVIAALNWIPAASIGPFAMATATDLMICIVIPFVIWSSLISLTDLVQHTHPELPWFNNKEEWTFYHAQVTATSHIELPWFLRVSSHNIFEHNAHHVDPKVPMYHLRQAQDDLEEHYCQDIVHPTLTFKELRHIFRTCQLYDYENHCWTTFNGAPTTPRLFPRGIPASHSHTH